MIDDAILREQLGKTLHETDFTGRGRLKAMRRGKVRDVYELDGAEQLLIVTTDRLSAFDRVLTTLPFKGEVLNRISAFWFRKTAEVIENHVLDVPDPNVTVARRTEPLAVEVVVRGYLSGSLWRDYLSGQANAAYGLSLPPGLRRDQPFPEPMVTPSTKAADGEHDLPLTTQEIVERGLLTARLWDEVRERAVTLFRLGQAWADRRGLILADTKYEFGREGPSLLLIDEVHTPDSSRFWEAEGSRERFERSEPQRMLDKENLRQWLIREREFQGHGPSPTIPDEVRADLAKTYINAFERVTGEAFDGHRGDVTERIEGNLHKAGYL
jgi:phosphoribosylaminoimidazole-succinocarboxamide synthase